MFTWLFVNNDVYLFPGMLLVWKKALKHSIVLSLQLKNLRLRKAPGGEEKRRERKTVHQTRAQIPLGKHVYVVGAYRLLRNRLPMYLLSHENHGCAQRRSRDRHGRAGNDYNSPPHSEALQMEDPKQVTFTNNDCSKRPARKQPVWSKLIP